MSLVDYCKDIEELKKALERANMSALIGELKRNIRLHEVFLSFRGEDTRASFTSHLHASLQNAGIKVFMDDDSLQRGDMISRSLLQAIEESDIAIIVFSRNYADSRWCLIELAKVMKCYKTIGKIVLPVFYDVDPSDVRHQTGEFGKGFQSLLNRISKEEEEEDKWRDDVDPSNVSHQKGEFGKGFRSVLNRILNEEEEHISLKWRDTLREAASLAGFVVLNSR